MEAIMLREAQRDEEGAQWHAGDRGDRGPLSQIQRNQTKLVFPSYFTFVNQLFNTTQRPRA